MATLRICNVDIIKSAANCAAFPTQTLGNITVYPFKSIFSCNVNVFYKRGDKLRFNVGLLITKIEQKMKFQIFTCIFWRFWLSFYFSKQKEKIVSIKSFEAISVQFSGFSFLVSRLASGIFLVVWQ